MDNGKYRELISSVIELIETTIREKTTLDDVSDRTGLSKFHLHRLFKSLTGCSMMEYARKRKLTVSLHELLQTDLRIIDIALEYGFEHEQSYIAPSKARSGPIRGNSGGKPAPFPSPRKSILKPCMEWVPTA